MIPRRSVLTLLVLYAVVGCSPAPSTGDAPTSAVKNPPGAVRHDLPPLTSRFPLLGEPTGSTWFAGTVGSDRAPGPSTYWIDAVVDVPSATVASLLAEHSPVPAGTSPDVVPELASEVPAGELLRSDELDAAFSTAQWLASVWVAPSSGRVVVVSIGQG